MVCWLDMYSKKKFDEEFAEMLLEGHHLACGNIDWMCITCMLLKGWWIITSTRLLLGVCCLVIYMCFLGWWGLLKIDGRWYLSIHYCQMVKYSIPQRRTVMNFLSPAARSPRDVCIINIALPFEQERGRWKKLLVIDYSSELGR